MALVDKKVLESERNQVYVKSTPGSRLNGTVSENKNVFDRFPQLIMNKYNELVDLLIASGLDTISEDITNRYTKTQVDDLIDTKTGVLVSDIAIDLTTGIITITKKDGTVSTIDTTLEKVPATFEFVQDTANDKYYIKVTNVDGTSSQTEVTNLMNQYTFTSGDKIQFTMTKIGTTTTITATIKAGSITMTELNASVKEYFDNLASTVAADKAAVASDKQYVIDASQTVTRNVTLVLESKQTAEDNATLSKSYAVGGTGSRAGENTDNAMYYANQAKTAKEAAEAAKNSAQEIVGGKYITESQFSQHTDDNEIHTSQAEKERWDGKANKATITAITILKSGWSNGTYSFESSYPAATHDIEIALNSTATTAQAEAFNGAQIVGSATSNVVKAYGEVPTVDIPVILRVVKK